MLNSSSAVDVLSLYSVEIEGIHPQLLDMQLHLLAHLLRYITDAWMKDENHARTIGKHLIRKYRE